ncbi:sigma-70 family RNA polymerase sigma factor [Flavobacteriaceae bacterium AU392]|nr:RNA polymerase sigma factor [Flavobacteriaceae bacterium]RKM81204.1 sigma-70 family RNA polymerase sigma factor [Flavobacteriaceae bacterium AU392]
MNSDKALIIQLQAKKELALSQLYDKYSGAIYGVILRMCKDEAQAQDLLQETFMTIWDKSYQYNPDKGRFYTWAYRIAKNKTLNFLRKPQELIQNEDLSVYTNKENEINIDSEYLKLNGSIKLLEKHHQRALELVYFNGLTHREAHIEMEVPLGTFKSYIKQALKKLQSLYSKTLAFLLALIEVVR